MKALYRKIFSSLCVFFALAVLFAGCGGGGGSGGVVPVISGVSNKWTAEKLASDTDLYFWTISSNIDAVVDRNNAIHIVYAFRDTDSKVYISYITNRTGSWVKTKLWEGSDPKVTMDNDNNTVIVYHYSGVVCKVSKNNIWEDVISIPNGFLPSIKVHQDKSFHIAYFIDDLNTNTRNFMYSTNKLGAWTYNNLYPTSGINGIDTSIIIDNNSVYPMYTYHSALTDDFTFMEYENSNWYPSFITGSSIGTNFSVKLNKSGAFYAVHFNKDLNGNSVIASATKNIGSANKWIITNLLSTPWAGTKISLDIDSSNYLHISYGDTNKGLSYLTNKGNVLSNELVDSSTLKPISHQANALVLDNNQIPHIIYYVQSTRSIMHATKL